MSYPGQYFPAYGMLPGENPASAYANLPLHPSVLHYRQNMVPHYGSSGAQQGLYFPPPGNLGNLGNLSLPPTSSPPGLCFPGGGVSTGGIASSSSWSLPPRKEHRPPIHEFNVKPPSVSSASMSGGHIVEYPRSTVETALMMSATFSDREPGEVILVSPPLPRENPTTRESPMTRESPPPERPSESERLAMLRGVNEGSEGEDSCKEEKDGGKRKSSSGTPQPVPEDTLLSLGLDRSVYRVVDGRYSCCLCMYTSPHLTHITTHLQAHRRRHSHTARKTPSPSPHDDTLSLNLNMDNPEENGQDSVPQNVVSRTGPVSIRAPILRGVLASPPVTAASISPRSTPGSVSPTSVSERRQSSESSGISKAGKKSHLTLPTYVIETPGINLDPEDDDPEDDDPDPDPDPDSAQNPSSLSALNECNYKHADSLLSVSAASCSPTLNQLRKSLNQEVGALLKNVLSKTNEGTVSDEKDENHNENGMMEKGEEDEREDEPMDYSMGNDPDGDMQDSQDSQDTGSSNGLSVLPVATVDDVFPMAGVGAGMGVGENLEGSGVGVGVGESIEEAAGVIPSPELYGATGSVPAVASVISLRCRLCNYSATSMKNLSKHYKAHRTARKVCKYCGKAFERPSDLVRHNERHLRDMKLTPECGWAANDKAKQKALKNLKCHRCSFTSSVKEVLAQHVRTKHNGWYACALCEASFRFVSSFTLHKMRAHGVPDSNVIDPGNASDGLGFAYSCRRCWINFPDVLRFSQHTMEQHPELPEAVENRKALGETVDDSDITADLNATTHDSDENPKDMSQDLIGGEGAVDSEHRPSTPEPGPHVLRIDTYQRNTLFMTELLKADVGENNELRLETEEVDLSEFKSPAPGVSTVSDCKTIISTMYKPQETSPTKQLPQPLKPTKQKTKEPTIKSFKPKKSMTYQQKRVSELTGGYYPNLASRIAKKSRSRFRRINLYRGPQANSGKITPKPENSMENSSINAENEASSEDSNSSFVDTPTMPRVHLKVEPGATDLSLKISSVYGNCDAQGIPLPNKFLAPRINPDAIFQCELCNYCTNTDSKFSQHMQAHKDGRLICKLCQKACIKISDLTRHWLTHFPSSDDGAVTELQCDSCDFKHSNKETMENHMKLHYHVNNTLPSTLTEEEFAKLAARLTKSSPESIRDHIRTPSPAKPSYHSVKKSEKRSVGRPKGGQQSPKSPKSPRNPKIACEICLKQVYKVQMDLHMSLHHPRASIEAGNDEADKPIEFTCDECGDSFDSRDAWRLHVKRHSDPKAKARKGKVNKYAGRNSKFASHLPSACPICDRRLCNKYYQAIHMKNKHGYKYQCKGCEEFFQKSGLYNEHIAKCSSGFLSQRRKNKKMETKLLKIVGLAQSDSDATIIDEKPEVIGVIDTLLGEGVENKESPMDGEDESPIKVNSDHDSPIKIMANFGSPVRLETSEEPTQKETSENDSSQNKSKKDDSKRGKDLNNVIDWDDENYEEGMDEEATGDDDI